MKIYVPDYYPRFRCIADRCRHTCCVGWEIDIDPGTLAQYRKIGGETGQKLRESIALSPEPHFILTDGERCPFLTDRNLCELILQGLPLCQICADHPRFRNYWSDRVEMGLGLACEEAARIILTSPGPLRLIPVGEDEEEEETPSEEETALRRYRDRLIASVREAGPLARLREYLLYRHLADALYDGRVEERLRFTDRAFHRISDGWDGDPETLIERARSFSNEVEYDDEKLEDMINGEG